MLSLYEAKAVLEVLGYPSTERNLREWSYRGALPRVERLEGRNREGGDTIYAWDNDLMAQVFTVTWFMADRSRLWEAKLRSWWAGFDYPVDEMRDLWVTWSDREVAQMQREMLGEEFDAVADRDFVAQIPAMLRASMPRIARANPPQWFDTVAALAIDPLFSAQDLGHRALTGLRRDIEVLARDNGDDGNLSALLAVLTDEGLCKAIEFVHRYFSPASLSVVLREAALADLEAAAADWRVLAAAYRWWIMETIKDLCLGTGDDDPLVLAILPSIVSRIGRAFMLVDLAVRQSGHRDEMNRSFEAFREVTTHPAIAVVAPVIRELLLEACARPTAAGDEASERMPERIRELEETHPEVTELRTRISRTRHTAGDLWRPVFAGTVWWKDVGTEPPLKSRSVGAINGGQQNG